MQNSVRVRPFPSTRPRSPSFGDAAEALQAMRLLLEASADRDSFAERLLAGARRFFRMDRAVLVKMATLDELTELDGPGAVRSLGGAEAAHLCESLGLPPEEDALLLLPIRVDDGVSHVLLLASSGPREFSEEQLDVAAAFAGAVGAAAADATESSQQAELSRAAQSLNASLDLNRVLVRICEESARILEADTAVVYLGDGDRGLQIEAGTGVGLDAIGVRLAAGEGLAGCVAETGEPMLARSALAVPLRWDDSLHGVLSLGWRRPEVLETEQLDLLSAFGEIAATACRNASTHEGLMTAARTDALTGCLNQAALHDTLRRELDRCERSGQRVSLAIVDMDNFKQVNERHGHLAGDEVLRRVGRALKRGVRPYDVVGRYGGDEFAIVAVDTAEADAREVAERAIRGVVRALEDLDASAGATAGVAQWRAGESATDLIRRADRALLFGKHEGERGTTLCASAVPAGFVPSGPQAALSESR